MTVKNSAVPEGREAKQRLRISATSCTTVHGGTVIRPGDVVEYQSRDARVIDVQPEENELLVYPYKAFGDSAERIYADAITGYMPREEYDG